jgi:hypothetical protein
MQWREKHRRRPKLHHIYIFNMSDQISKNNLYTKTKNRKNKISIEISNIE